MSLTIELLSPNFIGVQIFTSLAKKNLEITGLVSCLPSLASVVTTVWPVEVTKEQQVQNTCTCTARAQSTPSPYFIRRQAGLAKVHPCTEFGVPISKFP